MSRGVLPHSVLLLSDRLGAMLIGYGFRPADAVLAVDLVFDLAVDNRCGVAPEVPQRGEGSGDGLSGVERCRGRGSGDGLSGELSGS